MTDSENDIRRLAVGEENAGTRLDRFIADALADLSRQRVQTLIGDGRVRVEGAVATSTSLKVRAGQTIVVDIPPAAAATPLAETIPLDIVFEDSHLIVIDKPAGLVTHPAPGNETGTLVNALLAHFGDTLSGIGGVKRPGIVHRLDKETSGLLVVAKTDAAHHGLADQFASHGADGHLERSYVAVVWNVPDRPKSTVDARLGRSVANRRKIAVVTGEAGRHARTHYAVEQTFLADGKPVACLMRLTLETGRTHQIRVHMTAIGHPLLGDTTYGSGFKSSARKLSSEARQALDNLDRQALHAAVLGFTHPVTGEPHRYESPLPADLTRLIAALRHGG
ncbi:MAG TPA: RluA family pseudouridine synthase [Hyphomicrobiaceae bacterium]|nr:RluA family pseudouridine synthase [Hyphomicrobiaceae bacterium]